MQFSTAYDYNLLVPSSLFITVFVVDMSQLYANVHLFSLLLKSVVFVGQLVPDGLPADDTQIIHKGVSFIYSYQANTSENEVEVRVFPCFPQLPFGLATVDSLIGLVSSFRNRLSSLHFVRIVASDEP